ncbi:hypothetical protein QWY20_14485 [Alkalimonas sp. MEB108]|uniref:Uncharacterized protein n=1 Tax=Alkalimonas cellulosilytica TaxID=3058395 RepID=A0ABU7J828_9GAMM|nr:hypothetical protein [Alkalimonas sp. MEB108]MEE2002664.1 hypothetical protein [Alkalimonas sp. MEB108]
MDLNYTVKETIDQHSIEIIYHGLTGREIVLVDGEEKINRLNWGLKSEYLVQLNAEKHIRIRTQVNLKGVLQVNFIRGGNVLASHTSRMYEEVATNDVLQQPDNKAWLQEFQLPSMVVLVAFLSVLGGMKLMSTELLKLPVQLMLITLLTVAVAWLLFHLPIHKGQDAIQQRLWSGVLRFLGPGLMMGFAIGGIVGYSIGSFVAAMHTLLDKLA